MSQAFMKATHLTGDNVFLYGFDVQQSILFVSINRSGGPTPIQFDFMQTQAITITTQDDQGRPLTITLYKIKQQLVGIALEDPELADPTMFVSLKKKEKDMCVHWAWAGISELPATKEFLQDDTA
jgi:hypothetical protein